MARLTFAMWGLGGSGGELVIYKVAEELAKEGHEVSMAALVGWGWEDAGPSFNARVSVTTQARALRPIFSLEWLVEFDHRFRFASRLFPLLYAANRRALARLVKGTRPDLIVATSWYTIPAAVEASGGQVPVYAFVQDIVDAYILYDQYRGVEEFIRRAYRSGATMLSISSYVDNAIRRYSPDAKVVRVGYFVRDEFFEVPYIKPSQRTKIVSTIARCSPHKGFDVFVKAVRELWKRRKDFKVRILNRGCLALGDLGFPYEELPSRKSYSEVAEFYASSYALVFTSRFEGFGLPPLEAMATGTPVVMTYNEGSKEYARHGVNALVAEPENYRQVADYLDYLLDNPDEADRLSLGGVETARQFRFDKFMERFKAAIGL